MAAIYGGNVIRHLTKRTNIRRQDLLLANDGFLQIPEHWVQRPRFDVDEVQSWAYDIHSGRNGCVAQDISISEHALAIPGPRRLRQHRPVEYGGSAIIAVKSKRLRQRQVLPNHVGSVSALAGSFLYRHT